MCLLHCLQQQVDGTITLILKAPLPRSLLKLHHIVAIIGRKCFPFSLGSTANTPKIGEIKSLESRGMFPGCGDMLSRVLRTTSDAPSGSYCNRPQTHNCRTAGDLLVSSMLDRSKNLTMMASMVVTLVNSSFVVVIFGMSLANRFPVTGASKPSAPFWVLDFT